MLKKITIILILFTILMPYISFVSAISDIENNVNNIKSEITENVIENNNLEENENDVIKNEINNNISNYISEKNEINNNVVDIEKNEENTNTTDENLSNNVIYTNSTNENNTITNEIQNVTNTLINNEVNNTLSNTLINDNLNTTLENNVVIEEIEDLKENEEITSEKVLSADDTKVFYSTHVQNIGWQSYVSDGETAGTSGKSLRLEAIKINVITPENLEGSVKYSTHVQNIGWQDPVETAINEREENVAICGTKGAGLRLEAIKIELTGEIANQYDIYYRVHGQNFGWSGWAKNGEESGSAGYSLRLEGIEIKLVKKGEPAPGTTENRYYRAKPIVKYTTHVQNIGWQPYVQNGEMAGTSGKALRLEGIKLNLAGCFYEGNIEYRTHVQNMGWLDYVSVPANAKESNVLMSGTSGKSLRLEAIEIKLTGEVSEKFDIYYRVHAQNVGWLDWAKNGEQAGTSGYGFRLEGIEVLIVEKGKDAPGKTDIPFRKNYKGTMDIELPTKLQNYTVPNKDGVSPNVLNLKGWAISSDETAYIEVYLNGRKCNEQVIRTQRDDINENKIDGYKEALEVTKKSGFEAVIDISSLTESEHTITVIQRNRYGDATSTKDVKIDVKRPRYSGKTVIDTPTQNYTVIISNNNPTTINVNGWAVSEDELATVNIYLDNKLLLKNVTRIERTDVNVNKYPNYKDWIESTGLSGYSVNLTFDKNMLPANHTIKIEQVSRYGHVISSEERIINLVNDNFVYKGRMFIDEPVNGRLLIKERKDTFKIKGWAISNDSQAKVQIYIDGNLFDKNAVRETRDDVSVNTLPNNAEEVMLTPQSGFLTIDLPINEQGLNLSEGLHTITVKQLDRHGKLISEKSVQIRVIDKTYKGIDVSRHNAEVDWNQVVNEGFSFAILRIGYGKNNNQKDQYFEQNYKKCKELGIPVGIYLYSYAMDVEGALAEAENCLNWLGGRHFDLPVYFDLENKTAGYPQHTIPKETQTNMVIAFCDRIQSAGYKAGLYTSKNWMENNVDMSRIEDRYSVWVAHYTEGTDKVFMPTYNPLPTNYQGKYNMWQYTSNGNIGGKTFDFNILYY